MAGPPHSVAEAHHSKGWAAKLQGLPPSVGLGHGSQLPQESGQGNPCQFDWQGFFVLWPDSTGGRECQAQDGSWAWSLKA